MLDRLEAGRIMISLLVKKRKREILKDLEEFYVKTKSDRTENYLPILLQNFSYLGLRFFLARLLMSSRSDLDFSAAFLAAALPLGLK